ncbi:MAG: restriction endonuclease subunit S [Candidatus Ruminococcus intestinipullorum]|nr:restriction endonuclease subunit S [Candidatus Ruminococcus intestinipullorum]
MKCIEDEIPFEVPKGWAWTRLGNLCAAIQYGLSNSAEPKGSHKFLRITDIQNGMVNWDAVPFTSTSDPDVYLLEPGDIVFARTGATVGKSFLITETPYPSVYASYLIRIRLLGDLPPEYIYQFFDSACYWSQITDKSVGVGQPNCNGTALKELFIPLPPINEQLRIIPTVRKLLKHVTKIDTEEKALMSIVTATKAKILDLAIRGQLVPQNSDNEPASVLLERIREEKEDLIKQGKIKRDKKESSIFKGEDNSYYEKVGSEIHCINEEIPFEIPISWTFVRLKHIGAIVGGGTPKTNIPAYWNGDIPWLTPADFSDYNDMYISYGERYITSEGLNSSSAQLLPTNTVLYSSRAPIGYVAITKNVVSTNQGFKSIVPVNTDMSIYLYYCLKARTDNIIMRATGTTFKEISGSEMGETIIPLPPLREQERLCRKIIRLFSNISIIEKSLS